MISLSPRQQQIVAFLAEESAAGRRPPTQVELAARFDFTHQAARHHLNALASKGVIEFDRNTARGLRVLNAAVRQSTASLPLIGRIAAGSPITAAENVEEMIEVGPSAFHPRANCLFRVAGLSMIRIGVLPGDLAAVHYDPDPPTGGIVAAVVPDSRTDDLLWTLKRYKRQRGNVVLLSENDDQETYVPQVYGPDSGLQIVGRYAGLVRPQHGR